MKNKWMLWLVTLISISSFTAQAADYNEEDSCYEPKSYSALIGNFTKSNLEEAKGLQPCGPFLRDKDKRLVMNTKLISSKEDMIYHKDRLTEMGADADIIAESMSETPFLRSIIDLMQYPFLFFISIYGVTILTGSMMSGYSVKAAAGTLVQGMLVFALNKVTLLFTLVLIMFVGTLNFLNISLSDFESFDKIRGTNIVDNVDSFKQINKNIASSLLYNTAYNEVTGNYYTRNLIGQPEEIKADFWSLNATNKNPTLGEMLDYTRECNEDNAYHDVEHDYIMNISFNLTSLIDFSLAKLPNIMTFYSGGDPTSNYSCDETHFGEQTPLLKITSQIPNAVERFFTENYAVDMGSETSFSEDFDTLFSTIVGEVNELLEKSHEQAAGTSSTVESEIKMALKAVEEAGSSGQSITETTAHDTLIKNIKSSMGNIFTYNDDLNMEALELLQLNSMMIQQFKISKLFAATEETDDVYTDKYKNGFYYLEPFLIETVEKQLAYDCALSDGDTYENRVENASSLNSQFSALNKKVSFNAIGGMHCYYQNEDNTFIATGDPLNKDELLIEVKERAKAIEILLNAYDIAALELISQQKEIFDNVLLDFLNSMDTDMRSTISTNLVLVETEQAMIQALSSIRDSVDFTYNITDDTGKPSYYFNFLRFNENAFSSGTGDVAERIELKKYNLSPMFTEIYAPTLDAGKNTDKGIGELGDFDDFSVMLTTIAPLCPLVDNEGYCIASLMQINDSNLSTLTWHLGTVAAAKVAIDTGSAACNGFKNGDKNDNNVKLSPAKMIPGGQICLLFDGLSLISDTVLKLAFNILFIGTLFTFVASYIPFIFDMIIMFMSIVYIVVPILAIYVAFFTEIIKNITIYTLSTKTEQDYNALLSLPITLSALKNMALRILVFFILVGIFVFILTDGSIGGFIFEMLRDNATGGFWALLISIVCVYFGIPYAIFKSFTILDKIERNFMAYSNMKDEGMMSSSSGFNSFVTGMISGKVLMQVKGASNHLEDKIKQKAGKKGHDLRRKRNQKVLDEMPDTDYNNTDENKDQAQDNK